MKIQIPDNFMGKPIKGSMEKILADATSSPKIVPTPQNKVQVASAGDYWQISGVEYRNEIHDVDLAKQLLDGGKSKTQGDWANYSESAISQDEFHTPDYPLLYGLVRTLYSAKDDSAKARDVEEAKNFLKESAKANWLMTLTRITYKSTEEDLVTHNFGTSQRYEDKVDFVGPDEWVKDTRNPKPAQILLGTNDDISKINDVFKWLSEKDAYMWRLNSKCDRERVARFLVVSDWAVLYCGGDPSYSDASLGVRVRKKI